MEVSSTAQWQMISKEIQVRHSEACAVNMRRTHFTTDNILGWQNRTTKSWTCQVFRNFISAYVS